MKQKNERKPDDRKARLAEELRANLQRRKAQARARHQSGADRGSAEETDSSERRKG